MEKFEKLLQTLTEASLKINTLEIKIDETENKIIEVAEDLKNLNRDLWHPENGILIKVVELSQKLENATERLSHFEKLTTNQLSNIQKIFERRNNLILSIFLVFLTSLLGFLFTELSEKNNKETKVSEISKPLSLY